MNIQKLINEKIIKYEKAKGIAIKYRRNIMKEVKFRAYFNKDGKIWDWARCKEYIDVLGSNFFKDNSLIIMQYIGLKDKNGKEIYEGDILNIELDGEIIIAIVFWDNKRLCWNFKTIDGFDYFELFTGETPFEAINYIEIIGNIYENSELLKEDKNE